MHTGRSLIAWKMVSCGHRFHLRSSSDRSGERSPSQPTRQTSFRQIWQLRGGPNLLAWLNHGGSSSFPVLKSTALHPKFSRGPLPQHCRRHSILLLCNAARCLWLQEDLLRLISAVIRRPSLAGRIPKENLPWHCSHFSFGQRQTRILSKWAPKFSLQ